jgi:capsular polysaccharide transport system permease protein
MKPKVQRFRIRRPEGDGDPTPTGMAAAAPVPVVPPVDRMPERPRQPAALAASDGPETEIDLIRREGLTGRQLRHARRLAQKHDLPATSDFDAVRLLRKAGIDPQERSNLLELVSSDNLLGEERATPSRALTETPGDGQRLPQTITPAKVPSTEVRAEEALAGNVLRIQQDLARRRRRKSLLLAGRLALFVLLPAIIAAWYYYRIATPLYATHSQMVIQQADGLVSAGPSGLGGLLSGAVEANKDSIAVQGYLQSRDAMMRLDADQGFRTAFSGPAIDPLTRLPPDAPNEDVYSLYQRMVKIAYDPTEGIIKLEVLAPTPEQSVQFSKALIGYAEEQIDHLTQRKREDQMRDARASFEDAEAKMLEAQRRVVELQERYQVMSSEVEVSLISSQISALETQLSQERLALEQMKSNPQPNQARMAPVERRIATLEDEIARLRARMTQTGADGLSLPEVQSELLIAQANVETRQLMLATTLEQLETARIEANRQVRYLSLSVQPVAPDRPAYPRAFENTLVTLLIFAGIYLMISMTVAILREQVSG